MIDKSEYLQLESEAKEKYKLYWVSMKSSLSAAFCQELENSFKKLRSGKFYGLPKIHKSEHDPPMRPVVSQCSHPTYIISKYIDSVITEHIYLG